LGRLSCLTVTVPSWREGLQTAGDVRPIGVKPSDGIANALVYQFGRGRGHPGREVGQAFVEGVSPPRGAA
jgi:hypothetical protein